METDARMLHLLVEIEKTIANIHLFYSKRRDILTTYFAINHVDVVKSILLSVGVSENNLDNVLSLIGKEGFQVCKKIVIKMIVFSALVFLANN